MIEHRYIRVSKEYLVCLSEKSWYVRDEVLWFFFFLSDKRLYNIMEDAKRYARNMKFWDRLLRGIASREVQDGVDVSAVAMRYARLSGCITYTYIYILPDYDLLYTRIGYLTSARRRHGLLRDSINKLCRNDYMYIYIKYVYTTYILLL